MSLPNYLAKIKSSGIYRFVFDKSEVAAVPAETLRLVVGYSEKGPFNTPTYIKNSTEFIATYGNINKKLERRGVYFHRMALQALTAGPILALNLKKFSTEKVDAISFAPNVPMYKEDFATHAFEENIIELPIESVYNTTRFWVLEPDQLQKADKMDNYISLAATDSKDCSNTIFMRGAKVTGYDLTVKAWYSNMGEDMPSYFDGYENMLLSDFWAEIYVFKGRFTKELATSNALAPYFNVDKDGVVTLKRYVLNAFGDKVDALTALAADDNANFIKMYTGCLLPNFKDAGNNYVSLDLLFNADNYLHKMMMDFDIEMLDNGDITVDTLSTAGHLMITDDVMQSLVGSIDDLKAYETTQTKISMFSNLSIVPEISVAEFDGEKWNYKNSDFVADPHMYVYKLDPNESLTEGVSVDKFGKIGLVQGDRFMGTKREGDAIVPVYSTITKIDTKTLDKEDFIADLDKVTEVKDKVTNPEKSDLTKVTAKVEDKALVADQMFVAKFRPNIADDNKETLKDKIFTITGKVDKPEGADVKVKYYVPEMTEVTTKPIDDILNNRTFTGKIDIEPIYPELPEILNNRTFTDADKSTYTFLDNASKCIMHVKINKGGDVTFDVDATDLNAIKLTTVDVPKNLQSLWAPGAIGTFTSKPGTYSDSIVDILKGRSFIDNLAPEKGQSTYKFGPDATTCTMTLQSGQSVIMNNTIDEAGKTVTLKPQNPKEYYYSPEGGVPYTYTYTWKEAPEKEELILVRNIDISLIPEEKRNEFNQGWPTEITLTNTDKGIANPVYEIPENNNGDEKLVLFCTAVEGGAFTMSSKVLTLTGDPYVPATTADVSFKFTDNVCEFTQDGVIKNINYTFDEKASEVVFTDKTNPEQELSVVYAYTYTWKETPEKEELVLNKKDNLSNLDWFNGVILTNTDEGITNPTIETIIPAKWADLNITEDGLYTTGLQIPSDVLLDPTNDGISTLQIICGTSGKYSATFDYVNVEDLETPIIKLDAPMEFTLGNLNRIVYTFDNPINTYGDKFVVRCNSSIACDISTMRPIYMKGYTFASEKPKSMKMKDKLDWQENILSAITDYPGLRTALTNRTDVDYRYIVDTFEAYVASEVHSKLSIIAKEKDNALAFLNFPAVKTFIDCDYTSFTDERNRFNAKYIKEGGNKLKSPAVLFSLASEANGASFASYNTPVTFSDGTIKTFVPSAALVSNNFMTKYTSRQPYYIVAGPNYGRIIYTGMVGPDYNYSRADLDILEPMGVNAMVYVPRKGTYINSNQTAKQNPVTALSKINIRELVIFLQDEIEKLLQNYQWEFNTQVLRDTVKAKADVICENIKANGGLYAYVNVCDTTNNTNDVIDNEMFVLSTEIEPSKGAGKMVQELTIHKTGGLTSTIK